MLHRRAQFLKDSAASIAGRQSGLEDILVREVFVVHVVVDSAVFRNAFIHGLRHEPGVANLAHLVQRRVAHPGETVLVLWIIDKIVQLPRVLRGVVKLLRPAGVSSNTRTERR